MNDFNPGPGWHEVPPEAVEPGQESVIYRALPSPFASMDKYRAWIREPPAPLPTEPGYYVAKSPQYGGTVVVELLNRPKGQWVDAGDRQYLDDVQVRDLLPLVKLERPADVAKAVLQQVLHLESWNDGIPIKNIEALIRQYEAES